MTAYGAAPMDRGVAYMSEGSAAFARMRRALVSHVGDIPRGAVVEGAVLAASLNIPARHAAYILSQLAEEEARFLGWFRVIPKKGHFPQGRLDHPRIARQIALLRQEGVPFLDPMRVDLGRATLWHPPDTYRNRIWADAEDDEA